MKSFTRCTSLLVCSDCIGDVRLLGSGDSAAVGATGDAFAGGAFVGDAFAGGAFAGGAVAGGDAFVGDAFAGDTFAGDAFAGDAVAGCRPTCSVLRLLALEPPGGVLTGDGISPFCM